MKKFLKNVLLPVGQILLMLGLIFIALASFGSRVPFLAEHGLGFYSIVSGSMEPKLPVGSLIYTQPVKVESLQKGDVVTFLWRGDGVEKPIIVTHRIDEVVKQGSELLFRTKGDANKEADNRLVEAKDVMAKYAWQLPYLGYLSYFAQQPLGFVLLILLPSVALIVAEILELAEYRRKQEEPFQYMSRSERAAFSK